MPGKHPTTQLDLKISAIDAEIARVRARQAGPKVIDIFEETPTQLGIAWEFLEDTIPRRGWQKITRLDRVEFTNDKDLVAEFNGTYWRITSNAYFPAIGPSMPSVEWGVYLPDTIRDVVRCLQYKDHEPYTMDQMRERGVRFHRC